MKNSHNYRAMLTISKRVGWPAHFKTDLTVYDRQFVNSLTRTSSRAAFLWFLYEGGTHLVDLGAKDKCGFRKGSKAIRDIAGSVVDTFPEARSFIVRHGAIRELDSAIFRKG